MNKNEAKTLWHAFHQKHGMLPQAQALLKNPDEGSLYPVTVATYEAAKKIQLWWRKLCSKDTLISVNPNGQHSRFFKNFLNGQQVVKSLNKNKLDLLCGALNRGHWEHEIFSHVNLEFLSLSLFAANRISFQQLCTVLERVQTFRDFPHQKTHPILNDLGEFTKVAKDLFIPVILENNGYQFSSNHLEALRALVAELPKSEQIFYTANECADKDPVLLERMIFFGVVHCYESSYVLMARGIRDAIGLVTFGLEEYIPAIPRLGMQSLIDIETGMRKGQRYAAIAFPNTIPFRKIHGNDASHLGATGHDDYHSATVSSIPNRQLEIHFYMLDMIRKTTGIQFSYELWKLVDADIRTFYKHPDLKSEDGAVMFCESFKGLNLDIFFRNGLPNTLFILCLIDMIKAPQQWLRLGVLPEKMLYQFKEGYDDVQSIYQKVLQKDASRVMQVFKSQIYITLKAEKRLDKWNQILKMIDEHRSYFLSNLSFAKNPFDNELSLKFGRQFINRPKLNKLFDALLDKGLNIEEALNYARFSHAQQKQFKKGLYKHQLSPSEAILYVGARVHEANERKILFQIKPNYAHWIKYNLAKTIFALLSLIAIPFLIYHVRNAIKQQKITNQNRSFANLDESCQAGLGDGAQNQSHRDSSASFQTQLTHRLRCQKNANAKGKISKKRSVFIKTAKSSPGSQKLSTNAHGTSADAIRFMGGRNLKHRPRLVKASSHQAKSMR